MRKYLGFFLLEWRRVGEFRLDFLLYWVEPLFRTAIVLLFWKAVLEGGGTSVGGALGLPAFIGLILVSRVVALPLQNGERIAGAMEGPVLSGAMTAVLCRPVHPVWMNLTRIAVDYFRLGGFSLLLLAFGGLIAHALFGFTVLDLSAGHFVPFFASLLMGYLIHYFLYTALGLMSFWIGHVWSLLYIVTVLNMFLAGYLFPLEWVPWVDRLSRYLPFRYTSYSPAALLLGRESGGELARQGLMLLACMAVTLCIHRWALRRFEANGG